jgi:sugar O-acyltransferase (sialic acid O-acetyltransferase NeuD family)
VLDNSCSIIGYSGHGLVVAEAAKLSGLNLLHYSDLELKKENPFNLSYLGNEGNNDFKYWKKNIDFILGIGDNATRYSCGKRVLAKNCKLINISHPSSVISKNTKLGIGNFFSGRSVINPMSTIGNFCIINTGSIVEHDCVIKDAVHIAPGAILLGNVIVGEGSFIGANSVIKEGVKIGKNVVVGAGSVILKDVEDGIKIVGNPGRIL